MPDSSYSHILAAVGSTPWLVHEPVLRAIVRILEERTSGVRLDQAEIDRRIDAAERRAGPHKGAGKNGRVAVIPVVGVMAHRASFFADTSSSGTSVQAVQRAFRTALADDAVDAILFDVDSPGGQAAGVPELADEIRAARGIKPMGTVSNTLMASAALWPFAQVDEITVSPSSLTGSVGVVMAHVDETGMNEKLGVKVTLVHAGEHKVETYPDTSLSEDARAYMQSLVDDLYTKFLKGLADARGLTVKQVEAQFGGGRVLTPTQAVKAGMADRIGTIDSAILRLGEGKVKMRTGAQASAEQLRYAELVAQREALVAQGVDPELLAEPIAPEGFLAEGTTADDDGADPGEDVDEFALERAIAARNDRRRGA